MKIDGILSDQEIPQFNYKLTLQQNKEYRDNGCYTDEFQQVSQSTSTTKQSRTIKFQVEANQIYEYMKPADYKLTQNDEKKLGVFLKNTTHIIMDALNENISLKLIHKLDSISQSTRKETSEVYTLRNIKNKGIQIENQQEITDIQWNSNGLILAAGYGQLEHSGSCDHKGFISAWNIGRRDFQPDIPQIQFETKGCVMCLSFHPTKQNIIAAGFFTGQITIFDISLNENELASSEVDEYFHRESVTQLLWIESKGQINHSLLSLGSDGKILLWGVNVEQQSQTLNYAQKGFLMLRKRESQVESVGASCMARCYDDQSNYLIGSECGSVLRGMVNQIDKSSKGLFESHDTNIQWKEDAISFMNNINQKYLPEIKGFVEEYCKKRQIHDIQIKQIISSKPDIRKIYINPISFAYEAHYGTVFGISSSWHVRNLFATCSMDGQIRLYDILNARSLITIEYLNQYIVSIQFSPSRPCVFGACSTNGEIMLFDLKKDRKKEILRIKSSVVKANRSSTNIRFNPRQQDLLACSYIGQEIQVFQLSDDFVRPQQGEEQFLKNLIDELKQQG